LALKNKNHPLRGWFVWFVGVPGLASLIPYWEVTKQSLLCSLFYFIPCAENINIFAYS
jgi:hypothetical protein